MKSQMLDLVVKRNELIEGHYMLSATAQKVAAAVISKVNPKEKTVKPIRFTSVEIREIIGVTKQHYYKAIDEVTDDLGKVLIKHKDIKSGKVVKSNMFLRSIFDPADKTLVFEVHPDMIPYVIDFAGNFTKYQIKQIQQLKSKYAIRLYELLRKYHPIGSAKPASFCVIQLEDLRGIVGVENNKYTRFDNFRKNVLDRSAVELEKFTDLKFTFEAIRKARKVNAIKFAISHNCSFTADEDEDEIVKEGELLSADLPEIDPGIKAVIMKLIPGMGDAELQSLAIYDEAILTEAVVDFTRQCATGNIKKPVAYFVGIVKKKAKEAESEANKDTSCSGVDDLMDTSWADKYQFNFDE